MSEKKVGVIGGSSFVGERLKIFLEEKGYIAVLFSRSSADGQISLKSACCEKSVSIQNWICLAPIWVLPSYLPVLERYGVKNLVALSSTSRYSKISSPTSSERHIAEKLIQGEKRVTEWSQSAECRLTILQPTMIYGLKKDKNIARMTGFIDRFGFFPLFGKGAGLRQPIHVDDVACACISALERKGGRGGSYIISGEEVLTYRQMAERIFISLNRKPIFLCCPLWCFSLIIHFLKIFSLYKDLSTGMAARMDMDLNFDHTEAHIDLGFNPRKFDPNS